MGINSAESKFLFEEKIKEGRGEIKANREIIRDKKFIKKTKEKIKLQKKHEKKAKSRKKIRSEAFKKAFERLTAPKRSKKIQRKFNNMLVLYEKRIMNALTEKPQNKKSLCLNCCMTLGKVNEIILSLLKKGKIKENQINSREWIYSIC